MPRNRIKNITRAKDSKTTVAPPFFPSTKSLSERRAIVPAIALGGVTSVALLPLSILIGAMRDDLSPAAHAVATIDLSDCAQFKLLPNSTLLLFRI
jgi:hypothetical protein